MQTILKRRVYQVFFVAGMLVTFFVLALTTPQKTILVKMPVVPIHIKPQTETVVTVAVHETNIVGKMEENSTIFLIENGNTKKTYLPYKSFADWSNQYKLQQMAETNEYGLRVVNGRYCVAVGSYFNMNIGQKFDIQLENGTVIPCVMGDLKADEHTDDENLYTIHSNCMAEFIVETAKLPELAKDMGNVSYITEDWNSKIVSVTVYEENIFN